MSRHEQQIQAALGVLQKSIAPLSVPDKVDLGLFLHQTRHTVSEMLDGIKKALRADAQRRFAPGKTQDAIPGRQGASALVQYPTPIFRMAKGANVEALRSALGDDFGDFFQEVHSVEPRPEAMTRILDLPPAVQDILLRSLEQDVGVGGVSFSGRTP